jgi:hypothetical protein
MEVPEKRIYIAPGRQLALKVDYEFHKAFAVKNLV